MGVWIWALIAAGLFAVEVSAPGYFLIVPSIAAATVAILSSAGWTLIADPASAICLFAVLTGILFALAFRPYRRLVARQAPIAVNTSDRLLGAPATVEEPIVNGRGKVRLGDSVWLAAGPDLAKGVAVTVRRVDGTVLGIEPRAEGA